MKKLITSLFALMLAATAAFANYTEFKAVAVEFIDGQKTEDKLWVTKDKSRREFNRGREIVVSRNDLKVTWFIYPTIRCYVEIPALGTSANFNMPSETADTGDLKRKFICEEEREGFRMKKYLVTIKYSNMPGEDSYYEWCRNDFPVPVRTESLDGSYWTEYKNISRGPISADLFNKPAYKCVDSDTAERLLNEYEKKHPRKTTKNARQQNSKKQVKSDTVATTETGKSNIPENAVPKESNTQSKQDELLLQLLQPK